MTRTTKHPPQLSTSERRDSDEGANSLPLVASEMESEPDAAGQRIDPRGQGGADRTHPQLKDVSAGSVCSEASSGQALRDVPRLGRAKRVRLDGCQAPSARKPDTITCNGCGRAGEPLDDNLCPACNFLAEWMEGAEIWTSTDIADFTRRRKDDA